MVKEYVEEACTNDWCSSIFFIFFWGTALDRIWTLITIRPDHVHHCRPNELGPNKFINSKSEPALDHLMFSFLNRHK